MKQLTLLIISALCLACSQTVYARHTEAFLYGGTTEQYVLNVEELGFSPESVSPDYFFINENGTLDDRKANREFSESMHQLGIKVIPVLSNSWSRGAAGTAFENIENLTNSIASSIECYSFDGVNIDISNQPSEYAPKYLKFIRELHSKLNGKTLVITVSGNENFDFSELNKYCDAVILAAYDDTQATARPSAGKEYVETAVQRLSTKIPSQKIVLGIPFFGRYWKKGDNNPQNQANTITGRDVGNLVENYMTSHDYDERYQSAHVSLTVNPGDSPPKLWGGKALAPGNYEIWYDDAKALAYKLGLVEKYGLKGVSAWALGQADDDVMAKFRSYANGSTESDIPLSESELKRIREVLAQDSALIVTKNSATIISNGESPGEISNAVDSVRDNMTRHGWISGEEYQEGEILTKAQAIKFILRMAALPEAPKTADFNQTAEHPDREYLLKARYYGLIDPQELAAFMPDYPITKRDFVCLLDKVFNIPDSVNFFSEAASDISQKSDPMGYYAINKFLEHHILKASGGKIHPNRNITIGETAEILNKLDGYGLKNLIPNQPQKSGVIMPR